MRINRHPRGLVHLFLTELWERFSYYGLTALLILYLYHEFGATEREAYIIYGTYGTLVYMTPVIGGWLADRFLGSYRATFWGAILISIGHFVMMIPDPSHLGFYIGLAFIIVGTGLFKPNVANLVSKLYKNNPHLKDSGFTWAHIGCNIGTILAPVVCAYIAIMVSYPVAFGIAGIGMVIGILTLLSGKRYMVEGETTRSFLIPIGVVMGLILLVQQIFYHTEYAGYALGFIGVITLAFIAREIIMTSAESKKKMLLFSALMGFYLIFMVLLQLSGGPLNLFTDQYVNRTWMGLTIPTGAFQSVEPLAVVTLGVLYAKWWNKRVKNGSPARYVLFFALALLFQALSFLVLAVAVQFRGVDGLIQMSWINIAYILQAAGELFIAPIGLSMLSQWIPQKAFGVFMGAWILASAYANFIASRLGVMIAPATQNHTSIASYTNLFEWMVVLAGVGAIALLVGAYHITKKEVQHAI